MRVRITETTDGQYLGYEFNIDSNPIILEDDIQVYIDKIIPIEDGFRFINSNYIIDTRKIEE